MAIEAKSLEIIEPSRDAISERDRIVMGLGGLIGVFRGAYLDQYVQEFGRFSINQDPNSLTPELRNLAIALANFYLMVNSRTNQGG